MVLLLLQRGAYTVQGSLRSQLPASQVFSLLSDYGNLPNIFSAITEAHVLNEHAPMQLLQVGDTQLRCSLWSPIDDVTCPAPAMFLLSHCCLPEAFSCTSHHAWADQGLICKLAGLPMGIFGVQRHLQNFTEGP